MKSPERSSIRGLLPPRTAGAELLDFSAADQLLADEEAAIASAAPSRRLEFRAGRHCSRQALTLLGYPAQALPRRADRSVEWPLGIVGSVTHTHGYAAAVVARSADWRGIGIDAELRNGAEDPKLWPLIATAEEIAWLASKEGDLATYATLLFSAKEAFYKAQYCLTQQLLNFNEARFHLAETGFEIELLIDLREVGRRGSRIRGSYCFDGARVLTLVALAGTH
jgi:enterobactin synthetase component D